MQEPYYFSLQAPYEDIHSRVLFTVGVPLEKGQYFALQQLNCTRSDEKNVNATITPTGFWPDNSIKWLQIQGETTRENLENAVFSISEASVCAAVSNRNSPLVSTSDQKITIGCADISLCVDKEKLFTGTLSVANHVYQFGMNGLFKAPFENLRPELSDWHFNPSYDNTVGGNAFFLELTLHYTLHNPSTSLLPLVLTIKLNCYSHFGHCELQSTLCNPNPADHDAGTWDLGEGKSALIEDFTWFIKAEHTTAKLVADKHTTDSLQTIVSDSLLWQRSSTGQHWNSPNHLDRDRKIGIANPLSVVDINGSRGELPVRLSPSACLQQDMSTLHVEPQKFWQNFPTALTAAPGEICWHLFKAETEHPVELQPGEQKTHYWALTFNQGDIRYQKAAARLNPDWVAQCAVIPWFSSSLLSDPLQKIIHLGQSGGQNFFAKRERIDEFGWRHFGDLYADHETAEYDGNELFPSHYNNQYDPLYGFLKQWLLTGDSRWKELADDLARHIVDIDIYHCDHDKPEYNNGLFWHTDHYLPAETATHRTYSKHHKSDAYQDHAGGGGPGGQHCYTSGLQLYYFLTGCVEAKKAVLGLSDWITQVYESDGSLFGLLLQFKNRHRKDLKQVSTGRYPLDRGTANYMVALLDSYELTGNTILLEKVAFIIRHTVSPQDDIEHERNLKNVEECWFYTVFFQAVCRYLTVQQTVLLNGDFAYAKSSLIHYAKWMVEHEYPYLEKADILEYPNQTWSAQDLRKVHVLSVAATFAEPEWADRFTQKGHELKQYIVSALSQSNEREYTRILALVMQNYGVDTVLQTAKSTPIPDAIFSHQPPQRIAGWQAEVIRVLSQFSPRYEWQQLQKRIPKLRGNQGN